MRKLMDILSNLIMNIIVCSAKGGSKGDEN